MSEFWQDSLGVEKAFHESPSAPKTSASLLGPDGRIEGVVLTPSEYKKILYRSIKIPISDEELARRAKSKGVTTLAEIWKRLGVR